MNSTAIPFAAFDDTHIYFQTPVLTKPPPPRPRGKGWGKEDDIKILQNDWPYGIDPQIVHLVIWTKFPLHESPPAATATTNDNLTPAMRARIDAFVEKTFVKKMGRENVCSCRFLPRITEAPKAVRLMWMGDCSRLFGSRIGPR